MVGYKKYHKYTVNFKIKGRYAKHGDKYIHDHSLTSVKKREKNKNRIGTGTSLTFDYVYDPDKEIWILDEVYLLTGSCMGAFKL